MKNGSNLILATEWFKKADDNEASCEASLKEKAGPNTVCFLSH